VTASGERVALVVLLVARVLAEQAAVDAPVLTADAAAQTDLVVELERVDDRGLLHERGEQIAAHLLERVRGLVLADADVGGLQELAAVLDVGILDVDGAVGEVGLKLVLPALVEVALDAEARAAQLCRVVVLVEIVFVAERAAVHLQAAEHVYRPAAVLTREGRPGGPLDLDVGRFLLDLLHRLRGGVGLLGRLLRLALQRVDLARQLFDLPLLLADDVHQLGIALRLAGASRQGQHRSRASRREISVMTV
jgi:hypothetical protein